MYFKLREDYRAVTEGMKFTRNYKIKTGSLKKILFENKTEVKNAKIIFKTKFLNFLLMGRIH